jgi:hypothetical protein
VPAPATVRAAGRFSATRGGAAAGEAVLRMRNATRGSLSWGGQEWPLAATVATKRLHGQRAGQSLDLKIVNRNALKGSMGGAPLELARLTLRPIPPAELAQADKGPTGAMKTFMDSVPDYRAEVGDTDTFWYAFGPVLYRGRLDGSARLLGIASDPGPAECLPFMRRTLVGDSGQKTQGFLAKLGLARSYVLVNAFAVALHPGKAAKGRHLLANNAALKVWRHGFFDRLLAGGGVQAIVAFGDHAQAAYDLWAASNSAVAQVPVVKIPHPAAVDRDGSGNDAALKKWTRAVTRLRGFITPDAEASARGPNYGSYVTENDYARIPRWDLPAAAPPYAGDDSWGRAATPQHNNCCARPRPDDAVSLLLSPPPGQGRFLRYRYKDGRLVRATTKSGKTVATDANGIPV